jgi:ABC-2 type transport system permease protein
MNTALFKKEVKSNGFLFVIFLVVLGMYGVMVVMMFDPEMGDSLRTMAESMPDLFAAFGMADVGATLLEFVSGYLYGMLFVAFPGVYIIILANRLVAKYIDDGSMVYLLAVPEKRFKIILTQAAYLFLSLIALVGGTAVLILLVSGILFPGELEINAFLRLNVGLLGILVFFGGACFCFSCFCNESRISSLTGTAIVAYTILVQMISQVGDKFEKLKYVTAVTLFDTSGLCSGDKKAWAMCAILYGTGIFMTGVGIWRFCKRDLPL